MSTFRTRPIPCQPIKPLGAPCKMPSDLNPGEPKQPAIPQNKGFLDPILERLDALENHVRDIRENAIFRGGENWRVAKRQIRRLEERLEVVSAKVKRLEFVARAREGVTVSRPFTAPAVWSREVDQNGEQVPLYEVATPEPPDDKTSNFLREATQQAARLDAARRDRLVVRAALIGAGIENPTEQQVRDATSAAVREAIQVPLYPHNRPQTHPANKGTPDTPEATEPVRGQQEARQ